MEREIRCKERKESEREGGREEKWWDGEEREIKDGKGGRQEGII